VRVRLTSASEEVVVSELASSPLGTARVRARLTSASEEVA
jgi:hypothetical protein